MELFTGENLVPESANEAEETSAREPADPRWRRKTTTAGLRQQLAGRFRPMFLHLTFSPHRVRNV